MDVSFTGVRGRLSDLPSVRHFGGMSRRRTDGLQGKRWEVDWRQRRSSSRRVRISSARSRLVCERAANAEILALPPSLAGSAGCTLTLVFLGTAIQPPNYYYINLHVFRKTVQKEFLIHKLNAWMLFPS